MEHRLLMQAECPLLLCLGAEWWLRKLKEDGSAGFGDPVPVLGKQVSDCQLLGLHL